MAFLASSQRVVVHPVALASILDHHLRRFQGQDRVFGTLLGSADGDETHVTATLGLPYVVGQQGEQQLLQMDFEDLENDKTFNLLSRANPEGLDVVGWYTSAPELNSYTQLIHDRFSDKVDAMAAIKSASAFSDPRQAKAKAVHLTLDPSSLLCKAYVRAPCGVKASQNGLFTPIRTKVIMSDAEKPTVQALAQRTPATQTTPIESYAEQLHNLSDMLNNVIAHVNSILSGQSKPQPELAQMLLQTLGAISLPSQSSDKDKFEEEFEAHLADILMLSYLSNLAKYQMELSSRLALIPDKGMQQQQGQHAQQA